MRLLLLLAIGLLANGNCTAKPAIYLDIKGVYQNDDGSDWMLRPEREWIDETNNPRLHAHLGLAWEHLIDCPFIASGTDTLKWVHIGCSKGWEYWFYGTNTAIFAELAVIHQVDQWSSWWLRTDKQHVKPPSEIAQQYQDAPNVKWTGQNPFYHLRFGLKWRSGWKLAFATGRSMFQGAPFESEDNAPDLYWMHVELGYRFGGKK